MKRKLKENNNIIGDAIVGVVATVVSVITLSKKDIEVQKESLTDYNIEDRNNNDPNKENEGLAYHFYFRYDKRYKKIKVDNFQTFVEKMNTLVQKQRKTRKRNKKINVILTSGIELTEDITIDGSNTIEIEGQNYGFDQIYLTLIGKLTFGNNNKKINIFYDNVGDNTETKPNYDDKVNAIKIYGYLKGYNGLLYPVSSSNDYENSPKIKNIVVDSRNISNNTIFNSNNNNTSIYIGGGYLVQNESPYFNLVNCINKNEVKFANAGGLCGSDAGSQGECTLTNCKNIGNILETAEYSGGICGLYAGVRGQCFLNDCVNEGEIRAPNAGGLCGSDAGSQGECTLTNCKNIGNILETAEDSGGICGTYAGNNGGKCFLNNCVNTGEIRAEEAGGLCGVFAGYDSSNCSLSGCSNSGSIYGDSAGGLCGTYAGYYGKCFLNDCVNEGEIRAPNAGGICGSKAGIKEVTKGECILTNCKNIGNILNTATNSGGLCGANAGSYGGNCSLNDCVNEGSIYSFGSGGLCGAYAGYIGGNCSLSGCENSGSIVGDYSGGLCGSSAGNNGGDVIINKNCKNIGILNNLTNTGQLLGSISDSANLIEISKTTVLLNEPFTDKDARTNFNGYNNNSLRILGIQSEFTITVTNN